MKLIRTAILALAMPLAALAQTPTAPTPVNPPPALTETQQLKLENLELKLASIQQQAQVIANPLQQERLALIADIVKAHPGYKWHESAGQGDVEGLRPVPAPTPPPDKPHE